MYYPKSKIKENLYTDGNLLIDKFGKSYKGYYYSTIDNRYFIGKEFSSKSKELFLNTNQNDLSLSNESKIFNNINKQNINTDHPSFNYSFPTETDYQKGIYNRYFIKRVNGDYTNILEIDKIQYKTFKNNVLYISIEIPWKLRITFEKSIEDIFNSNNNTSKEADIKIKGLDNYLSNKLQFFRKN